MRRANSILVMMGAIAFGILVPVGTYAIISRSVFSKSVHWTEAALTILVILVAFWGAADRVIANRHIRIDIVYVKMPARFKRWADVIADAGGLIACGISAYYCVIYTKFLFDTGTTYQSAQEIPIWIILAGISLGLTLMTLTYGERLIRDIRQVTGQLPPEAKPTEAKTEGGRVA